MKETRKRILLFCSITFGIYWAAVLIAFACGLRYGDDTFKNLNLVMMLVPMAAMLVTRRVTEEAIELDSAGLAPHFKGNILRYVFAYVFPTLLAGLTGLLFFAVHPAQYDPAAETLIDSLVTDAVTREMASGAVYQQVLMGIAAGPLVNIITSAAEVLGFQGYLLPKLREFFGDKGGGWKAALACGGLWGLWYAPLLADGYLYGRGYPGYPFLGILLGIVFYTLLTVVLSYLTMKTGSIFPAALARGGVTAMAAMPLYFTKGGSTLLTGPVVYSVFGCAALLLFAALYFLRIRRMEKAGTLSYQKNER